jgi:hypothetical protein
MVVACNPETLFDALARSFVEDRQFSADYVRKFRQARQTDHDEDDDSGENIIRFHELKRRLVADARFYQKFAPGKWTGEEREALAAHARGLVASIHNFLWTVEPLQQAAE